MNTQLNRRFALPILISLLLPLSSSGYIDGDIHSDWSNAGPSVYNGKQPTILGSTSEQILHFHDHGAFLDERLNGPVFLGELKSNRTSCQPVGSDILIINVRACRHLLGKTETTAETVASKSAVEIADSLFPAKASKPVFEIQSSVNNGAGNRLVLKEAGKMRALSGLQQANSGVWRVIDLHTEGCLMQSFIGEKDQAEIGLNGCRFESVRKISSQHL